MAPTCRAIFLKQRHDLESHSRTRRHSFAGNWSLSIRTNGNVRRVTKLSDSWHKVCESWCDSHCEGRSLYLHENRKVIALDSHERRKRTCHHNDSGVAWHDVNDFDNDYGCVLAVSQHSTDYVPTPE